MQPHGNLLLLLNGSETEMQLLRRKFKIHYIVVNSIRKICNSLSSSNTHHFVFKKLPGRRSQQYTRPPVNIISMDNIIYDTQQ